MAQEKNFETEEIRHFAVGVPANSKASLGVCTMMDGYCRRNDPLGTTSPF